MKRKRAVRSRGPRYQEALSEILEAAAEAIAEHGYHGMSMRDLARTTGRSLANFYNYFSSKEDLLFALQAHAFETLISSAKEGITAVKSPSTRLYVLIFNHLSYAASHRAVMRVLVHEASALPSPRRKIVRTLKERYFGIGRKIVASILAQDGGNQDTSSRCIVDASELERVTYSIFGMIIWSYGWYNPKRHGDPREVATTIHRIALCGLTSQTPDAPTQEDMERHLETFSPPPLIGRLGRTEEAL